MNRMDADKIESGERAIKRVDKLLGNTHVEKYPLCAERIRLITESWEQTDGKSMILRLAEAFNHLVEKMTIYIDEGELIAGNGASKSMGLEIDPFMGPFSEDELRNLEGEGFVEISDEEAEGITNVKAAIAFLKERGVQD